MLPSGWADEASIYLFAVDFKTVYDAIQVKRDAYDSRKASRIGEMGIMGATVITPGSR